MSIRSFLSRRAPRPPAPDAAPAAPDRAPRNGAGIAALREEMLVHGVDAARALALADALEESGRMLEALAALVVAGRLRRDAALERRLVRLRQAAGLQLDGALAPTAWPHWRLDDVPAPPAGPVEVAAADFDARVLKSGLLRNGHVLVRGLVPPARVERLRTAVQQAFHAAEVAYAGGPTSETLPWCDPLEGIPQGDEHRFAVRAAQGILACDSPRALFELTETLHDLGLDDLIASYFGERPALSAKKCTLRRADASDVRVRHASWHQDGAFLGDGIRTLNLWFALTRCGTDAPGMEMVPARLDNLLSRGGAGAHFDWTVSTETLRRELPGVSIWRPEFEEGDVLFFDHLFLHRTAAYEHMANLRYAIESWFFAPSVYADDPATLLVV